MLLWSVIFVLEHVVFEQLETAPGDGSWAKLLLFIELLLPFASFARTVRQ